MNDIAADFFENTRALTQRQLDWLVQQGVPPLALARDPGEIDFVIGTASIDVDGDIFVFATEDTGNAMNALIIVARDCAGEPKDLVAWLPKTNWTATHYGRVALLGEHDTHAPRMSKALVVHKGVLSWLRANRTGVVIVDRKRAWRALDGVMIAAESVEHGLELRKVLSPPPPWIVVPSNSECAAA